MKIVVVGPGCHRCNATEQNVVDACAELNLTADITHVHDVTKFPSLGVFMTPSLLVDGKIVLSGRVPTVAELKLLLSKHVTPATV